MKRASKRIIITSEQVNYYGFRVLTDGIELSQYKKNPVMLWMHTRAFSPSENGILPLGNVIELKRETHPEYGKVITGLPVFDDTDAFAMRIYKKYENGTIRMASSGLRPVDWSEEPEYLVPGQRGATLVKSILEEISLCDIGGNDDALQVALYNDNRELIQLSLSGENAAIPLIKHPLIETEMNKIELTAAKAAALLGVKELTTADEFETKIAEVVQLSARQKTQIETLSREKQEALDKLAEAEQIQLTAKVESLVQGAVDARKITADEKPMYVELAKANYDSVEKLLSVKAGTPTVQTQLSAGSAQTAGKYTGKTWDDLDKSGQLIQLKSADINLFKQLFKDKYGKDYAG
ncbi:hypothetical protein FW774_17300 [Pedobacter sp. BS3]|uniref:hypothetical protein n=1 Tax=Pedobacter sp. BS3 TaxID=2567937 RepID=UPI0011EC0E27|nr:hypothetical protein [Pedobacter sp. BS3]TZF81813.1 hypothetical protein FW774_17300 [Pedobacter sp. BS3]